MFASLPDAGRRASPLGALLLRSPRPGAPMPLIVKEWPIGKLKAYEKNPRRNDPAVPRMVENLKEFGWRVPLLARSDGELIDGHLRLKAARAMGMDTVPVALADDMTPAQVQAFRIAVNRSATWAEWDDDLLRGELGELSAEGFDLALTGFDAGELDKLLAVPEEPEGTFKQYDETIEVEHQCPKCGYQFSGGKTSRKRTVEE